MPPKRQLSPGLVGNAKRTKTTEQDDELGEQPLTVVLSESGDVVIRTTRDDHKHYLTSSIILKNASEVWAADLAAMNNKHDVSQGISSGLVLDEDPQVLNILLHMLHAKQTAVPRYLTASELLNLSMLADKYHCSDAILQSLQTCQRDAMSKCKDFTSVAMLAVTALKTKDSVRFCALTKRLMFDFSDPLDDISRNQDDTTMQHYLSLLPLEKMKASRKELAKAMKRGRSMGDHSHGCQCTPIFVDTIWSILERIKDVPLSESLKSLAGIYKSGEMEAARKNCRSSGYICVNSDTDRDSFLPTWYRLVEDMKKAAKGLCMQCVIGDMPDESTCGKHAKARRNRHG